VIPLSLTSQAEELTGAVGGVGGKPLGPQRKAPFGPIDHGLSRGHLVVGSSFLDIDDDGVLDIDQIVSP
jgi:hypothetical protein